MATMFGKPWFLREIGFTCAIVLRPQRHYPRLRSNEPVCNIYVGIEPVHISFVSRIPRGYIKAV